MDLRTEHVLVETDRWRIEGDLTLPREGFRSRLSDFVNQRDREFFSIRNARLIALDRPGESKDVPFVKVASRHIRLIVPADSDPR